MSKKIPNISAEKFSYELYEPNYWDRLNLRNNFDITDIIRIAKDKAVGWCDANRLLVRPRSHMIAVMFEDEDGEKFWFHEPSWPFEGMLEEEGN